jgi:hypothetical protein
MGTETYDLEELSRRPSRPKRIFYLLLWFLIVFGTPFFSSYLWARYYEHGSNIESVVSALTIVVCISLAEILWFWRGMIYIAFSTDRNLILKKLALYAISIGGRPWTREEWEEDQDWFFFFDQWWHK